MKTYFFSIICRSNRYVALAELERCIAAYGFVTDFKFFSDLSASLQIELQQKNLEPLKTSIAAIAHVESDELHMGKPEVECTLFCNITFAQGTGELTIDVPAVPG